MRSFCIALAAVCALALAASPAAHAAGAGDTTKMMGHMTKAERTNARNVIAFYQASINEKDFDKARAFIGDRYIQHNPTAQEGIEGFKAFLTFLQTTFPTSHSEVLRAWANDNYVILHVRSSRPPPNGRAIVDIFRLEHGKIVEHWDVGQEIPEKPANTNTMF